MKNTVLIYLFALATLVLAACVSGGLGTVLPAPTNVAIIAPASDLAPDLAAFSGIWEGVWEEALPSRLIVERIDATSAQVVYIWGESLSGRAQPGWSRHNAIILPDGKIQWGPVGRRDSRFTFTMSKDRMSITGERQGRSYRNITVMEKIGQQ